MRLHGNDNTISLPLTTAKTNGHTDASEKSDKRSVESPTPSKKSQEKRGTPIQCPFRHKASLTLANTQDKELRFVDTLHKKLLPSADQVNQNYTCTVTRKFTYVISKISQVQTVPHSRKVSLINLINMFTFCSVGQSP